MYQQNYYEKGNVTFDDASFILDAVCDYLKISPPRVTILKVTDDFPNEYLEEFTKSPGKLLLPSSVPNLKVPNIILAMDLIPSLDVLTVILAQECRHIWQFYKNKKLYKTKMESSNDYHMNKSAIDADGFAIYFLSDALLYSIEKAAEIVIPDMYSQNPEAYYLRLDVAQTIRTQFTPSKELLRYIPLY